MEEKDIKISIVIPVYNAEKLIVRCLDSIFNQTCQQDLEILAVDDGSTDSSLKILENYSNGIKIFNQENKGAAVARNVGIENATGQYIAFLDADDYWKPEFLDRTLSFIDKNPEVIAVNTGQIHKIPGRPDVISPAFIGSTNVVFPKEGVLEDFYSFWGVYNHVCTGSVLMKTEVVKKTGGQLPQLRISQDLEFWSYLATYGKWGFIPEILFVSDGGKVTRERGWLKKNTIRWKATPSVDTFKERTEPKITEEQHVGYAKVIGWVAYNFTYGHVMARDYDKAYHNISLYGKDFPESKGSKLVNISYKYGRFGFKTIMSVFRFLQILRHYLFTLRA